MYYPGRARSTAVNPPYKVLFCAFANTGNVLPSAAKLSRKDLQMCCSSRKLLLWTIGCNCSRSLTIRPGIALKLIERMGQPLFVAIQSCATLFFSRTTNVQINVPNCTDSKLHPDLRTIATYFCSAVKSSLDFSDGILSSQNTPGHDFGKSASVIVDSNGCASSSSSSSSVTSCAK